MAWMQFSHGIRLDPTATKLPEALVVLLHDFGGSAAMLTAKLARWATMVPATAFVALDGVERPESATDGAMDGALANGAGGGVAGIARAAQDLELLVDQQLRSYRLGPNRLVLAGFGYGGTVALHLLLHRGWTCAGVLAYGAKVVRPLPGSLQVQSKVRLIECIGDGHVGYGSVREVVSLLTDRGIDARGVLLGGSVFSDAAIRHGGAYLVELVATAQRGADRFQSNSETHHA
ncbi:MAG TPA: hypothetical protein VGB82_03710 [Alphaproteobacteria bacterium]